MNTKKTLVSVAVGSALGVSSIAANAEVVQSFDLGNVLGGGNSGTITLTPDTRRSDFAFGAVPSGNSSNTFGFTGETGCTNAADTTTCDPIDMTSTGATGTNVFSTGFNFGGTGVFSPNITAGGMTGSITGTTLTFTSLEFGGIFGGGQFFLAPNVLSNCTGTAGCGTTDTAGYEALIITTGTTGEYGVRVRYVGTIDNPASPFNGFQANWRLEGTMRTDAYSAVPIPAAAYLMGSGLIGLAGVARRRKKNA